MLPSSNTKVCKDRTLVGNLSVMVVFWITLTISKEPGIWPLITRYKRPQLWLFFNNLGIKLFQDALYFWYVRFRDKDYQRLLIGGWQKYSTHKLSMSHYSSCLFNKNQLRATPCFFDFNLSICRTNQQWTIV